MYPALLTFDINVCIVMHLLIYNMIIHGPFLKKLILIAYQKTPGKWML